MTVNQLSYYDKVHSFNFFILLNHIHIILFTFSALLMLWIWPSTWNRYKLKSIVGTVTANNWKKKLIIIFCLYIKLFKYTVVGFYWLNLLGNPKIWCGKFLWTGYSTYFHNLRRLYCTWTAIFHLCTLIRIFKIN